MKKVGILTLCGNFNFGNKLQNYAVVKTLENMNLSVNTIWIENANKASNKAQLKKYYNRIKKDYFTSHKRRKYFIKFNKYLNLKYRLIFNNDFKKVNNKFDYFVVGSDQVWNYQFANNESFYLLTDSNKNNIAFSASFGIDSLPDKLKDTYKKGLKGFKAISVREDKGKEIVDELLNNKKTEVLVDPTMMLTSSEWDKISNSPKQMKLLNEKKYILNYFLGDLSDDNLKEIKRVAKENDCEIINILDKKDPFYNCGPSEFLYLEKNAFLICTDSFHSSVFAILYNRPFVIFKRKTDNIANMYSRIDTLLSKFKLENREFNGKKITKKNMEHDYNKAYEILECERNKALKFLNKAFDIK